MPEGGRYSGRVIAVTGAGGYLGSALVERLLAEGAADIIRVSRKLMDDRPGTTVVNADIRELGTWRSLASRADAIFHLAGNTSVYEAARDPAASLNSTVLPICHLHEAARVTGKRLRVVFASTATVYGPTPQQPVPESFEPRPTTVYDLHKLLAEQQLALATDQGVAEGVSLRLANVYGPSGGAFSAADRGALTRVVNQALEGQGLSVYGGGDYIRDYVYISDVIDAVLRAGLDSGLAGQSFNIGTGIGTTVRQMFEWVAQEARAQTGKSVLVFPAAWPSGTDPIELRQFTADIARFKLATGWVPLVGPREGIRLLVASVAKGGAAKERGSQ
jgi:nucleoside-diphosphate-sugar epimerase